MSQTASETDPLVAGVGPCATDSDSDEPHENLRTAGVIEIDGINNTGGAVMGEVDTSDYERTGRHREGAIDSHRASCRQSRCRGRGFRECEIIIDGSGDTERLRASSRKNQSTRTTGERSSTTYIS